LTIVELIKIVLMPTQYSLVASPVIVNHNASSLGKNWIQQILIVLTHTPC